MDRMSVLSIFSDFALGLTPGKMREAMGKLSQEVTTEMRRLVELNKELLCDKEYARSQFSMEVGVLNDTIKDLKSDLEYTQQQLRINSQNSESSKKIALNILNRLINEKVLKDDQGIIEQEIVAHYEDTKHKIQCIKFVRQITNLGLKQCKDLFESWVD